MTDCCRLQKTLLGVFTCHHLPPHSSLSLLPSSLYIRSTRRRREIVLILSIHDIKSHVILKRPLLTRGGNLTSYIWPLLSLSTQSTIKSVLLSSLQTHPDLSKKLCDTISELASGILPDNAWPELLPFIFRCVTSDSTNLQESAFLIFAHLSQFIGHTLVPFITDLHSVFLNCLANSTAANVRIAALNVVINFIQCLQSSSDRDRFQDLLPAMMRTLTEALNSGEEATAHEALELLIELAGVEPRFLRRQLVEVVEAMLQISEAVQLEEGTRHLAVEFVITLAEARERAPGMMRKLPQFISRLFGILIKMLLLLPKLLRDVHRDSLSLASAFCFLSLYYKSRYCPL